MEIKPDGARVVVRVDTAETRTKGGILIPETAKDRRTTLTGRIIAVGPGGMMAESFEKWVFRECKHKLGERVLFGKYVGHEAYSDSKETLFVVEEKDILGTVSE